ncbi:MAG: methyl-accepting chemotaxis protein [Alphaproteobacteria bacterium]|nr:methyl-accepting chemotaxis protein [Alphaproteobacteria bacterium]
MQFFAGLRGRIALLGVLPALAGAMLATMAGLYSLRDLRDDRMQAALDAAAFRAENMLNEGQVRMGTYAVALAQQAALVNAIASGDAALIRHRILNSMEMLRANDPSVSVLEVTDAQGRVLLRGHNPAQAGDDKSRVADVARALRGEIAPGITLSPTSGEFAYGGVVPLRQEGRVVGTLKVAGRMEIDTARQIGRLVDGEVMLFANGRMRTSTIEGLDPVTILPLLAENSPARGEAGTVWPLPGRGDHLMRFLPIRDLEGQVAGGMLIALPLRGWYAAETHSMLISLLSALAVLLVALPVALLVAMRIGRPLAGMAGAMRSISSGQLDVTIPGVARRDEVGAMAAALQVFRDNAERNRALEAEAAAGRAQRERRAQAVERYTEDFGLSVGGVMSEFETAASSMRAAAQRMAEVANETQARADSTARQSGSAAENLAAVAAAVEELSATVGEISRQVAQAAAVASEAVHETRTSDERMLALTRSADRIGDVLSVISDVAGRTNLLALNATIEAARAGEAGKGFAIVASEVKNLAAQTAKATEDVSAQITAMRRAAGEAATVMHGIATTISRINEATGTIAAAVEEQGAATREITERLQNVTVATAGVSEAMHSVRGTAEEAQASSAEVRSAAEGVQHQAGLLRGEVQGFLHNLRAEGDERRSFDRVAGGGQRARLVMDGQVEEVLIRDVSGSGIAIMSGKKLAPGKAVNLEFHSGAKVKARVARWDNGVLGLVFAEQVNVQDILGQRQRAA